MDNIADIQYRDQCSSFTRDIGMVISSTFFNRFYFVFVDRLLNISLKEIKKEISIFSQ